MRASRTSTHLLLSLLPLSVVACLTAPNINPPAEDAGEDATSLDAGRDAAPPAQDAHADAHDAALPPVDAGIDATPDATPDASVQDAAPDATPLTCSDGSVACGDACVNEQSDDNNCGGCGVLCSGTCALAECVTVLATGQDTPRGIAVNGTSVYWVNDDGPGAIMAVSTDGGGLTTVFANVTYASELAAGGGNLYWLAEDDASTEAVFCGPQPSGGDAAVVDLSAPNVVEEMAAGTDGVFWTTEPTEDGGTVATAPFDGGPPTNIAFGLDYSYELAVGPTEVVWTNGGAITGAALDGGDVMTIAADTSPQGMVVDSTYVYWTTGYGGAVMKAPLDGGPTTTLLQMGNSTGEMFVDSTNLYWLAIPHVEIGKVRHTPDVPVGLDDGGLDDGGEADDASPGLDASGTYVMRMTTDGGGVTVLAALPAEPNAFTVDSTSVYWTVDLAGLEDGGSYNDAGLVMKLSPK